MKIILQITPSGVKIVDNYGDAVTAPPELMLHASATVFYGNFLLLICACENAGK